MAWLELPGQVARGGQTRLSYKRASRDASRGETCPTNCDDPSETSRRRSLDYGPAPHDRRASTCRQQQAREVTDMQQARPTANSFVGAILLLVISVFISYVDRGNLSVAAPLIKSELSLSASQLGLLLSAFFWSYTGMLFVSASFMDRWDVTRILPIGFLVWSIATAAMGS